MALHVSTPVLIPAVLLLLYFVFLRPRRTKHTVPLPPGPPRDLLIGNLRILPTVRQPEVFHEWAKTYGDIMYLEVLGRRMVILDSLEVANDLLDKRSAKYSSRPRVVVFDRMGWDKALACLPYGSDFFVHRRLFQQYFGRQESLSFVPYQTREALVVVNKLMKNPMNYDAILQRYVTSTVLQVVYGYHIESDDDPMLKLTSDFMEIIHKSGPVATSPAEFLPWLLDLPDWSPFSLYAKFAREGKLYTDRFISYPFEVVRKQLSQNAALPSFVSTQLNDINPDMPAKERDEYLNHIKYAAGMSYLAASETTYGTLAVFLLAMVLHPQFQYNAQAEIDRVVGPNRLPNMEDRPSLPSVDYIMQETIRWQPVMPMALPHLTTEDDVYRGMFIPKDTLVFPNIRGMTLHENVHRNATMFDPDRYIPAMKGGRGESWIHPYGFGRRVCPGRYMGENSLWIAMAIILATCDIRKAKNERGEEITPEVSHAYGATSIINPFVYTLVPRSAKAENLVR